MLLSCSLFDETGETRLDLVHNRKSDKTFEALVGDKVVSAQRMTDEHGVERSLFVFTDLSVRIPGTFRLRFDLIDILAR